MENNQIKNQIRANKIRIVLGVIFIIFAWGITAYKGLLSQKYYVIMIAAFTIVTIFLYIVKPYSSNKKLESKLDE